MNDAVTTVLGREDYRSILRDELERRQERNLNYSQRAFARDLGIGPNRLSEILNEKQGLSAAYAKQIAKKLGYKSLESEYFCELVRERHARNQRERLSASRRLGELREKIQYHPISLDVFRFISDWYHLAIIELSKTKSFRPEVAWIAKKLVLSASEVREALSRLERIGLLVRKNGAFRFLKTDNSLPESIPADSIKKFHEGILRRATASLYTQALSEREYSSTMIAIDKEAVPEVKRRIAGFWKQIDKDFGGRGTATHVYALGIQFFSLTESSNE